jgi:hypothetical protein
MAGYLVAVTEQAETLYVIRSKAAFTLPAAFRARILPTLELEAYRHRGYYIHPVARDWTSADAILAQWDRWTDPSTHWIPLRLRPGGTFIDPDGQILALPGISFDGLVGTRQDGRAALRDLRRYTYRLCCDLTILEVAREGERVALLYA